jgi:hypothetical protein
MVSLKRIARYFLGKASFTSRGIFVQAPAALPHHAVSSNSGPKWGPKWGPRDFPSKKDKNRCNP